MRKGWICSLPFGGNKRAKFPFARHLQDAKLFEVSHARSTCSFQQPYNMDLIIVPILPNEIPEALWSHSICPRSCIWWKILAWSPLAEWSGLAIWRECLKDSYLIPFSLSIKVSLAFNQYLLLCFQGTGNTGTNRVTALPVFKGSSMKAQTSQGAAGVRWSAENCAVSPKARNS